MKISKVRLKIFITIWLVYMLFMYVKPESVSGNLVDLAMSIVDNGNVYLRYSTNTIDVAYFDGNYVSAHLAGGSFPVIPLYFIFKPFLGGIEGALRLTVVHLLSIIFISSVSGAIIAVIFYSFLKRFGMKESDRLLLTFLFAFGTMNFGYSTALYKLIQASLYLFTAFFLLFRIKLGERHGLAQYFWIGFLLAVAIACQPMVICITIILLIYGLHVGGVKKLPLMLAGAVIPCAAVLAYLKAGFGSFFVNPYAFKVNPDPNILVFPRWQNFLHLFFSLQEGFFIYMPIMILSLWGAWEAFRRKQYKVEVTVILSITILTGVAVSSFFSKYSYIKDLWPHEAHIAIRYMLPLCPFLMLPISFIVNKVRKGILYCLGGVSIFFSYLGAQAGLLPSFSGGWQTVYAIKVFVSSFGMPTLFSQVLPDIMGIDIFHTYVSRPDIKLGYLLAPQNRDLLLLLIRNQLFFFALFLMAVVLIMLIVWKIWQNEKIRSY